MPDYSPYILPGFTWTTTAAGTIWVGDPVEVAGPGTVRKCTAGGLAGYVGVAGQDVTPGKDLTVYSVRPIFEGTADGAVNAGDQLTPSAAAGKQVTALPPAGTTFAGTYSAADVKTQVDAAVNAARAVIGVALTTAADGMTVRWQQR